MSRSRHTLDWISPDIAALTLSAGASWTDCLNAFEQLSEANLAGRPVNYLLQLSGPVSFACGPDGDNLADFFLDFIPARTALALVRPASPAPQACEVAFYTRLAAAGYQVGHFIRRDTAVSWLETAPTLCAQRNRQCNCACPDALSPDCPSVRAQRSLLPVRRLARSGPGQLPERQARSG